MQGRKNFLTLHHISLSLCPVWTVISGLIASRGGRCFRSRFSCNRNNISLEQPAGERFSGPCREQRPCAHSEAPEKPRELNTQLPLQCKEVCSCSSWKARNEVVSQPDNPLSGTCALGGTWWKILADSHLRVYSRRVPSPASWVQPLLSAVERWG